MKGFSLSNLKYMRQWYLFFEKSQQVVGQITQIPWGHNIAIISRCNELGWVLKDKNPTTFLFTHP